MMAILMMIMGLAAMFGFFLAVYFFVYRLKNLSAPLRWTGGILGGVMAGALSALAVLLLLWPPLSIVLLGVALLIAGIVATVVLAGGPEGNKQEACQYLTGTSNNGGGQDDDMDPYGTYLNSGTRP